MRPPLPAEVGPLVRSRRAVLRLQLLLTHNSRDIFGKKKKKKKHNLAVRVKLSSFSHLYGPGRDGGSLIGSTVPAITI